MSETPRQPSIWREGRSLTLKVGQFCPHVSDESAMAEALWFPGTLTHTFGYHQANYRNSSALESSISSIHCQWVADNLIHTGSSGLLPRPKIQGVLANASKKKSNDDTTSCLHIDLPRIGPV